MRANPDRFVLGFDVRHVYDVFTRLEAGRTFPVEVGEQVLLDVFLMSHPMQPWVNEQLAPDATWYGTARPYGEPDPKDASMETILIEFSRVETPDNSWKLPWQVDQDDVLVVVAQPDQPLGQLGSLSEGDGLRAKIRMEVSQLEALETIPQTGEQLWRLVLVPAGEKVDALILSEVMIGNP